MSLFFSIFNVAFSALSYPLGETTSTTEYSPTGRPLIIKAPDSPVLTISTPSVLENVYWPSEPLKKTLFPSLSIILNSDFTRAVDV